VRVRTIASIARPPAGAAKESCIREDEVANSAIAWRVMSSMHAPSNPVTTT
jgi:hypothetical protein